MVERNASRKRPRRWTKGRPFERFEETQKKGRARSEISISEMFFQPVIDSFAARQGDYRQLPVAEGVG